MPSLLIRIRKPKLNRACGNKSLHSNATTTTFLDLSIHLPTTAAMENNAPTTVSRAPAQAFECTICSFEMENESAILINSNPVCVDCIKDRIVPRFYDAFKHEINYPIEYFAGVVLNPNDFAEFFDDYPRFTEKWAEKEKEYNTQPPTNRTYCKNVSKESGETCEAFIGDRTKFLLDIAFCARCEDYVCSRCGVKEEEHVCKTGEGTPEDLKGFKRCPG